MKTIHKVVGQSDENLSSALNTILIMPTEFSSRNNEENASLLDNTNMTKKPISLMKHFEHNLPFHPDRFDQFQAARYGNLEQIKRLHFNNQENAKVFFNRTDLETKLTALHYAARFQHFHICQYLIERCQANVDQPGEDGMTPLHYIARFRVEKTNQNNGNETYETIVRYLIQQGAQINKQDNYRST